MEVRDEPNPVDETKELLSILPQRSYYFCCNGATLAHLPRTMYKIVYTIMYRYQAKNAKNI